MAKITINDLSKDELAQYPGFEELSSEELEEALLFILQMADILLQIED